MDSYDRRELLRSVALSGLGLAAGHDRAGRGGRWIQPTDRRVTAADAARRTTGRTCDHVLTASADHVDLGGPVVATWTYGGELPGRQIRVRAGDIVRARLVNRLPAATTVHWHGVPVRNDMDGVPDLTQAATNPGQDFVYRFVAERPGTYWFHSHLGVQRDRGLYAPLIVEDPSEPADHDHDWTLVLDDWIDGTGTTPDRVLAELQAGMRRTAPGTMRHHHPAPGTPANRKSDLLGGDAGDVAYPYFLVNGRIATAPQVLHARPGQRARIRLINAAGDTAFRVAVAGHRFRVTHTDGSPVTPVETGALLIGMGERYDLTVTLADGVFPLTALAEGKGGTARALIRTGSGAPPPATARPAELDGEILRCARLRPADPHPRLRRPDTEHVLDLTGSMARYDWGINGRRHDLTHPLPIRDGERVRVTFRNRTMMWHPMHIHGHTFRINGDGPFKDTVIVLPRQTLTCDFDADNPGRWLTHCHNAYHNAAGMVTVLGYRT